MEKVAKIDELGHALARVGRTWVPLVEAAQRVAQGMDLSLGQARFLLDTARLHLMLEISPGPPLACRASGNSWVDLPEEGRTRGLNLEMLTPQERGRAPLVANINGVVTSKRLAQTLGVSTSRAAVAGRVFNMAGVLYRVKDRPAEYLMTGAYADFLREHPPEGQPRVVRSSAPAARPVGVGPQLELPAPKVVPPKVVPPKVVVREGQDEPYLEGCIEKFLMSPRGRRVLFRALAQGYPPNLTALGEEERRE